MRVLDEFWHRDARPAVIIGGGVGPMAGVRLHEHIIHGTVAPLGDCDHVDVWHLAEVARMPDRTRFLLGHTKQNPGDAMADNVAPIGELLAARGRQWLVAVPCATFHAPLIFDRLLCLLVGKKGFVGAISLVEETIRAIKALPGAPRRVGVLATAGSQSTGVWREPLQARGFDVVEGSSALQVKVHDAIYNGDYGLKTVAPPSARAEATVEMACRALRDEGAQVVVLGCTELSLVRETVGRYFGGDLAICDPLQILARAVVDAAVERPSGIAVTEYNQLHQPAVGGLVPCLASEVGV